MWKKVILQLPKKKISPEYRRYLYLYTSWLMDELGISRTDKQKMLYERYRKWSRRQLTDEELEDWVEVLETLYSH